MGEWVWTIDVRTGVGTDSILMVRLAADILLDSVALRAKGVRSKRLSIRSLAGRLADDEPFRVGTPYLTSRFLIALLTCVNVDMMTDASSATITNGRCTIIIIITK
jgi:hypothetical protein